MDTYTCNRLSNMLKSGKFQFGSTFAFIDCGGPEFDISVNGKIFHFEMHSYCGPVALDKRKGKEGSPLKNQPQEFLEAASLWAQQGQNIDGKGLCIWFHEPKEILKHLGGKHWKIIGYEPSVKGQ